VGGEARGGGASGGKEKGERRRPHCGCASPGDVKQIKANRGY